MSANFPGSTNAVPEAYSEVITNSRGASIPAGSRLAVIMGEGAREERVVASAVGGGNDGLDSTYSSTTGADGRHFLLGQGQTVAPIISNRTRLFKNGVELTVLEDAIDENTFDARYGARVDIDTGRIELQGASLVLQGAAYYSAGTNNTGNGTISGLTLEDIDAPAETWTIRCSSIRRDGYGEPVPGYAKFIARGSVSGTILDGYGTQIVWYSDGVPVSNTILEFAINEGSTPFREGDSFVIMVAGGALVARDSLSAIYISELDINDAELFTEMNAVTAKHGTPSATNRLSLGAQLAFSNAPPGIYTLQTAPSLPRRVSRSLVTSASGSAALSDLTFDLPLGVVPDSLSDVNFFVTNPVTKVESQLIPNKTAFYDTAITANPSLFVFGASYTYSYTVIQNAVTGICSILFTDDLALASGASLRATVIDTRDADFYDAGWLNAYEAIEKIDIDVVVPLPSQTISTIFMNGKAHVINQSNIKSKHERVLFIGAIQGLDPENVTGVEAAAVEDIGVLEGIQGDSVAELLAGNDEDLADYGVQAAYGDTFRVVYFYPDEIVVQAGSANITVDGFFIAAAAAGWISGQPNVNEPLTNKTLGGFTILRSKLYSPLVIEDVASKGISLLQPVTGGGRVIWGKTTTLSGYPEEEEISIVFIRDRIAKSMRTAFRGYIGKAESDTFQATLFARATAAVQSFISQRLITDYRDLVVVRDAVEPRQWNVAVAVQPVYPVNWIYIRVDLGAF